MAIRYDKQKNEYTLKERNEQEELNENVIPQKYSPVDKYAKYRRQ